MPAIRTTPAGRAPPQKTERTHLENQERAYVAASRRSDRSLEARIESAKRASAIHKQRTGREFKITEQIVQDEEMYEEQDDNMPYQYRGLAAHLQSTDPQFNARLSAFLQTQIGMRDMVANGMNGMNGMNGTNGMNFSYGHPGDTQFAQFPQAMGANQGQHNQPLQQAQNPSMPIRQAPYPPRLQQQLGFSGFSPQGNQPSHYSGHHRSMSYSVPKREPQPNAMHPSMDNHRRMSTPGAPSSQSPAMSPHGVHSAHSTPGSRPAFLSRHSSGHMTHMAISQSQSQQQTSIAYSHQDYFPLTPQLSREAQGLMGSTLDQSNPMNSMLMAGSGNLTSTWYDFGLSQPTPAENVPRHQVHPTREGLFSTVAPAALESQETKFFDEAFPANTTTDTATPVDADNSIWDHFTNVDFTGGDLATTEGFNNEDWTCLKSPVS